MRSALAALRDADWLTGERARAWCVVLAAVSALLVGWVLVASGGGGLDPLGRPIGLDFIGFYAASTLALGGMAAAAYDPVAHEAAQIAVFGGTVSGVAFFYPPVFLLMCLPLALLPYQAALLAWLAVGFGAMWAGVRRVVPGRWAVLPMLAFPGVLATAGHGQNGFLSAACWSGCAVLMRRRPFMAGLCLGALVFKPHLLLAAPVVLVARRRWAVVSGAAVSAVGLVGLSWLVLGAAAWRGFFAVAPLARMTLEAGLVSVVKMASVFAAVRVLGGEVWLGYAVRGVVAGWVVWMVWRVRGDGVAEGAAMALGGMLMTPFLLSYDLTGLVLPLAWMMGEARRTGWLGWEKIVLLGAYVMPVAGPVLAGMGVPVAPVVVAALLGVLVRRTRRWGCG